MLFSSAPAELVLLLYLFFFASLRLGFGARASLSTRALQVLSLARCTAAIYAALLHVSQPPVTWTVFALRALASLCVVPVFQHGSSQRRTTTAVSPQAGTATWLASAVVPVCWAASATLQLVALVYTHGTWLQQPAWSTRMTAADVGILGLLLLVLAWRAAATSFRSCSPGRSQPPYLLISPALGQGTLAQQDLTSTAAAPAAGDSTAGSSGTANPEDSASMAQRAFFTWAWTMLRRGKHHEGLHPNFVPPLSALDDSASLHRTFRLAMAKRGLEVPGLKAKPPTASTATAATAAAAERTAATATAAVLMAEASSSSPSLSPQSPRRNTPAPHHASTMAQPTTTAPQPQVPALSAVTLLAAAHSANASLVYFPALLILVSTIASFGAPFITKALLDVLDADTTDARHTPDTSGPQAYGLAVALFCCTLVQSVCEHQFWALSQRCALHVRTMLMAAVYDHVLRMPAAGLSQLSEGYLANLLLVDASRVYDTLVVPNLHWGTWCSAVILTVALYFLYAYLGMAALCGLGVFVLTWPCALAVARVVKKHSANVQRLRDRRAQCLQAALGMVRTLIAYCWQSGVADLISRVRKEEIASQRRKQFATVFLNFVVVSGRVLAPSLSFLAYVYLNKTTPLTAATAFACLTWYNLLRRPMAFLPNAIANAMDTAVSFRRIASLLSKKVCRSVL